MGAVLFYILAGPRWRSATDAGRLIYCRPRSGGASPSFRVTVCSGRREDGPLRASRFQARWRTAVRLGCSLNKVVTVSPRVTHQYREVGERLPRGVCPRGGAVAWRVSYLIIQFAY